MIAAALFARIRSHLLLAAVAAAAALVALPAHAQTLVTWTGTGGNANWSTTNNWTAGGPPTTTGTWGLTFTGTNQAVSGTVTLFDNIGGTSDAVTISNLAIVSTASTAFSLQRANSRTLTLIDGGTISTQNSIGSSNRNRLNIPITLSGSATFNLASNNNLQLDAALSGGTTITKSGAGILFFQNNVTQNVNFTGGEFYMNSGVTSGTITFNGGTSFIGSTGNYTSQFLFLTNGQVRSWGGATTTFTSSTFNLPSAAASDVVLSLNSSGASEIQGVIQDNTSKKLGVTLNLAGASWRFSGNNTYTGTTNLSGTATLTIGNGGTTGALSPSSAITGVAGSTLAFNRSNTVTQGTDFASVIGGAINLTKQGSGGLVLNGLNTYSGTTQVSAGLLHVTSSGSINNTAGVIVNGAGAELRYNAASALTKPLTLTQGTLSGTGTLNTAVTVGSNAIHSPGNSPGSQTVQSETWASGGTYLWELNSLTGTAGANWDQIAVTGTLGLGTLSVGGKFNLDLVTLTGGNITGPLDVGYVAGSTHQFTIATFGSLAVPAGFTTTPGSDLTSLFNISLTGWQGTKPNTSDISVRVNASSGLDLVIVPEPGAIALAGIGIAAVARGLLRRRL